MGGGKKRKGEFGGAPRDHATIIPGAGSIVNVVHTSYANIKPAIKNEIEPWVVPCVS